MAIELQSELVALRRAILTMGASVEQRVARVFDALHNRDSIAAKAIRKSDDEIDQMDLDIEAECLHILALSQPVAGDLRFVLAVMRINNDLERIGDQVKGIGKRIVALGKQDPIDPPDALRAMAEEALRMLHEALAAFSNGDTSVCRQIRRDDKRVDDLQKEIFVWVQNEIASDVSKMESAINILSISRKIERIADLATNIAEDVIFLIEGTIVRHAQR
jgi:phosphate transport system protein